MSRDDNDPEVAWADDDERPRKKRQTEGEVEDVGDIDNLVPDVSEAPSPVIVGGAILIGAGAAALGGAVAHLAADDVKRSQGWQEARPGRFMSKLTPGESRYDVEEPRFLRNMRRRFEHED